VWHLFVILVRDKDRDALQKELAERGVGTGVHYPTPVPLQPAYASLGHKPGDFPVAESVMRSCLSLPMFAEMTDEEVRHVASALRECFSVHTTR
jgi:dTDP-4-amino-4,6-dideoxygalactose transaminase